MFENVQEKELPNIFIYQGDFPELYSPSSPFVLQYYQTKESLMDVEIYKRFLWIFNMNIYINSIFSIF